MLSRNIRLPDCAISVNIDFLEIDVYSICIEETRQRGRFAGFSLHVSNNNEIDGDSLCYKDGPELPSLNFTRACARSGRYIIIYNDRLTSGGYPSGYQLANVFTELCEVFVYGKVPFLCLISNPLLL